MGNSNGKIYGVIDLETDVYKVLGLGGLPDVGTACGSEKINKWSKRKPLAIGGMKPISNQDRYDCRYGIENIPYFDTFEDMVSYIRTGSPVAGNCPEPYFDYSMIGAEWFRLTDFEGYWHYAPKPIDVVTKRVQAEKYYNGIELPNQGRYIELHISREVENEDGICLEDLRIMGGMNLFALSQAGVAVQFQLLSYDAQNYYYRTAYTLLGDNLYSEYTESELAGDMLVYPYLRSSSTVGDVTTTTYCPLVFAGGAVVVTPYAEPWEFSIVSAVRVHSPDNTQTFVVVNVSIANHTSAAIAATIHVEAQQTEGLEGNTVVHGQADYERELAAQTSTVYTFQVDVPGRSQLEAVDQVEVYIEAAGLKKRKYHTEITG